MYYMIRTPYDRASAKKCDFWQRRPERKTISREKEEPSSGNNLEEKLRKVPHSGRLAPARLIHFLRKSREH